MVINNGEDDEADDSALTRKDDQLTEKIRDAEDEDSKDDATWTQRVKKIRFSLKLSNIQKIQASSLKNPKTKLQT